MGSPSDLLQSNGWEQFQRALDRETERVDGVLAIRMPLPFGLKYLYTPRAGGQLMVDGGELSNIARSTRAVFLRLEWNRKPSTINHQPSIPRVMRRAVEPEWTWRTSLEGSDDELLAWMHEKHRYNVRVAERRGVVVRAAPSPHAPPPEEGGKEKSFLPFHRSGGGVRGGGDFEICWKLLQETARRQGISTHPRRYYETMLRELPQTTLYLAEHGGAAIACAIVAYHGDAATYLHGGSSYEHRALMASHLVHWQAMRDAKAAGMRWYDWGGVQPEAGSRKPEALTPQSAIGSNWSGMTRFKMGFGGEAAHHPPTQDLIFRPRVYKILSWLAMVRETRERR